jgi:cation diffusion facilitator CzcD-associated flavoprotein CzcO
MFSDAVIVGAGPAGLAAAQRLQSRGLKPLLLEKADQVGAAWRRHYDRLHLHTPRIHSSLPGLPMPRAFGRYPSRAQFVEYLETYAERFGLKPAFSTRVESIRRDGRQFVVETSGETVKTRIVVMATGWADFPHVPKWPGMGLYQGQILHSSAYRNSATYIGGRPLVVGFGNSGAEIALDLADSGVDVTLSQRSAIRILPRDLFGVPILEFALAERFLPARLADALNAPFLRLALGSIEKLGFKKAGKGAMRMIEEDRRIPVLDIGAVKAIREGRIKVRGAVRAFTRSGAAFAEGQEQAFDAVVLATGYKPDLRSLLPDARGVLDGDGRPLVSDHPTAEPGLYFVGALASPTGQLREIRLGATRIADLARQFLEDERGFAAGGKLGAA